ncbi:MAG TPA: tetratricopeptide repeat protein, partial [Polyangia bacterium]
SDQAAYHAWLGWAVYQAEGPSALPRVVAALRQACDVDPESPEGNRWLGEVLLANGDRSGARVHLERALARGPERALVALLAQIHVDAGEPAQAEKLYMRVITALGEREPRTRAELWRDLAGVLRGSLADEAAAATAEATASELERGSSEGHQGTER